MDCIVKEKLFKNREIEFTRQGSCRYAYPLIFYKKMKVRLPGKCKIEGASFSRF